MRWVRGRRAGVGPAVSGGFVHSPGAFWRALVRLIAIAIPLAALLAVFLTRPEPPPEPPATSLSAHAPSPSLHPHLPSVDTDLPSADLPSVGAPSVGAPSPPSIHFGGGGSGYAYDEPEEEEDTGPRVVRERIHEHDYQVDVHWSWWLALLAAILVLALFLLLPVNYYTVLAVAAACSLALWLGIEVVYAGDYPEVFGSRDSYFSDGVKHITVIYNHLHPVNVRAPLVLLALGLGAWTGRGLWRLYHRPRPSIPFRPSTTET